MIPMEALFLGHMEVVMAKEVVVSSDSHVFEPPDLWTSRIESRFRDRAPRMRRVGNEDHLIVEGDQKMPQGWFDYLGHLVRIDRSPVIHRFCGHV